MLGHHRASGLTAASSHGLSREGSDREANAATQVLTDVRGLDAHAVGRRRAALTETVSTVTSATYVGKRRADVGGESRIPPTAFTPDGTQGGHSSLARGVQTACRPTPAEPDRTLPTLASSDHSTPPADEVVAEPPMQTRASRSSPGGGRRRAQKPARSHIRAACAATLSNPVLMGSAALAMAVSGVLTTSEPPQPTSTDARTVAVGALNGWEGSGTVRPDTISRDGDRDSVDDLSVAPGLLARARQRSAALAELARQANARSGLLAANQWVLPLSSYRLTATFGEYGLWSSYHTGLDFAADSGSRILSVARGTITSAGYEGPYGNRTVLTLEDGTEIWFCHQDTILVTPGDAVAAGDVIGTVGSTGNVTGPHLHLEVRPGGGDPVDPRTALTNNGVAP